jgi:hypothetical protein
VLVAVAAAGSAVPAAVGQFQADTKSGQHALRVIARVRLLQTVRSTRNDSEGTEDVDVEAQSHQTWKRWVAGLSFEDAKRLRLWRAGAVGTPTRHGHREGFSAACPWCDHPRASARHLWQECPRFEVMRRQLSLEYGIHPGWWQRQPRVTSKSGWITEAAHEDPARRPVLQLMSCRLALKVVAAVHSGQ